MTSAGPISRTWRTGRCSTGAPAVTLTEGLAATHQAILGGDRMALPLDHHRATAVAGGALAHPGLVCDVSIGQSTLATHHVRANLFYRGGCGSTGSRCSATPCPPAPRWRH